MPALREKDGAGVVTLLDSILKQRKDFHCGPWGSTESRTRYATLILEWETAGRRWPEQDVGTGITVGEIVDRYWTWARTYYAAGEVASIRCAWQVLVETAGQLAATSFGPLKLRDVQNAMVAKGWNRVFINRQVQRVIAIFKWATSTEILNASIHHALQTIRPLKRGRCAAPEPVAVEPVATVDVDAVRPWVSRQVWALIELQRYTGARPGELMPLRAADIDRTGNIWRLKIDQHKTAHHGAKRALYFGPMAQAVLAPWLLRAETAYLFSPAEAEDERLKLATSERTTPEGLGHVATGRRRDVGERYTTATYRRAIARAVVRANAWARGGLVCDVKWEAYRHWHPNQLRHSAATDIRKRFGLEAAQMVLGHSSALITDAVYAQRDQTRVEEVMRQIG